MLMKPQTLRWYQGECILEGFKLQEDLDKNVRICIKEKSYVSSKHVEDVLDMITRLSAVFKGGLCAP